MSRRLKLNAVAMLLAGAALSGSPAAALAGGSGGSGFGPSPTTSTSSTATSTGGVTTTATLQANGNGVAITSSSATLLRSRLRVSGRVESPRHDEIVEIERRSTGSGQWLFTAHSSVSSAGAFTVSWPTNHVGRFLIRAVIGSSLGTISRAAATSPSIAVTIYKPAIATTYGEGEWGSRTACGEMLRHATLGVANRTLPCGTRVSLLWHGRTIVVPVIDRGPYANHADWDLTSATASALNIPGTETVGAAPLS